jgi:hypothetical protein
MMARSGERLSCQRTSQGTEPLSTKEIVSSRQAELPAKTRNV